MKRKYSTVNIEDRIKSLVNSLKVASAMNSWNKKLTFKAYRAAKVLSGQLSELYAA